jgi:hypothetical protein
VRREDALGVALCVGWEEDVSRAVCGIVFLAGIHESVLNFLFLFFSRKKEKNEMMKKLDTTSLLKKLVLIS